MVLIHPLSEEGQRLTCLGLAVVGWWSARAGGVRGRQDAVDQLPLDALGGTVAGGVEQVAEVVVTVVGVAEQGQGQRGGKCTGQQTVGVLAQLGEQLGPPRWWWPVRARCR